MEKVRCVRSRASVPAQGKNRAALIKDNCGRAMMFQCFRTNPRHKYSIKLSSCEIEIVIFSSSTQYDNHWSYFELFPSWFRYNFHTFHGSYMSYSVQMILRHQLPHVLNNEDILHLTFLIYSIQYQI